jgi:hypothetical protein
VIVTRDTWKIDSVDDVADMGRSNAAPVHDYRGEWLLHAAKREESDVVVEFLAATVFVDAG